MLGLAATAAVVIEVIAGDSHFLVVDPDRPGYGLHVPIAVLLMMLSMIVVACLNRRAAHVMVLSCRQQHSRGEFDTAVVVRLETRLLVEGILEAHTVVRYVGARLLLIGIQGGGVLHYTAILGDRLLLLCRVYYLVSGGRCVVAEVLKRLPQIDELSAIAGA